MTRQPEFYPSAIKPSRAITVVVHGLNNKPAVMKDLADFLCSVGSDVVLVSLTGHLNDGQGMQYVTRKMWQDDLYGAYQYAVSINEKSEPRPLYFLGYSLGALINLDLITQLPQAVKYEKMVLLAPANALRKRVQFLKKISSVLLRRSWKIPSLMPRAYRADKFTPVQAYRILFEIGAAIEKTAYVSLHIPTLIIIDPRDEMISVQKMQKMQERFNLKKWQLYILKSQPKGKYSYHHLILDESSAGKERWHNIQTQIKLFLQLDD